MNHDDHAYPAFPKFPAKRPRGYKAIERACIHVREQLGFDLDERLPGWQLFESLGKWAIEIDGEVIPATYDVDALEPGVEAEARFNPHQKCFELVLSEESYDSLESDRLGRPRFTICHEMAHIILHPRELIEISRIPRQRAALMRSRFSDIPPYRDAEWQANAFAGCILMPARALESLRQEHGYLEEEMVAQHFGASLPCASVRLSIFVNRRRELLGA